MGEMNRKKRFGRWKKKKRKKERKKVRKKERKKEVKKESKKESSVKFSLIRKKVSNLIASTKKF